MFGGFAVLLGVAALVATGGCEDDTTQDLRATDRTIGHYCDLLLPSFCTYAVNTCGVSGTVADCVTVARPSCCQGACQRAARPVCATDPCPEGGEDEVVGACLLAYTGSSTPIADGTGSAGSGGASGAAGLDCASLAVGFAPPACREKFLLLDAPPPPAVGGDGRPVEVR